MTTDYDPASVADTRNQAADQALGEFEPDNDGTNDGGAVEPAPGADRADAADDQWIIWADAMLESAWADGDVAASWLAALRVVPTR
jgi:hypothetical protein